MFELNKPNNYKVKLFQEIDGFDKDQYGNTWYNVLFEGDAETYMWLKKDPPEEAKEYYGHIEKTASGKRLRFKTDKLPEGQQPVTESPKPSNAFLKDITDMPDRWMGRLLPYFDAQSLVKDGEITERGRHFLETAITLAEESMNLVDKVRSGSQATSVPTHAPQPIKAEVTPATGSILQHKMDKSDWNEPLPDFQGE